MGKVRRLRQKYHIALKSSILEKNNETATLASAKTLPVVISVPYKAPFPVKLNNDANIFSGINISPADLRQTLLPETKTNQTILGADGEENSVKCDGIKSLSKKDKRMARRAELLRKIDTVGSLKLQAKKKLKSKQKEVQFTGVQQLMDALPTLSELPPASKIHQKSKFSNLKLKEIQKTSRKKSVLPQKQRKKKYLEDIKTFKVVFSHDSYKADPLSAISNLVVNSISRSN